MTGTREEFLEWDQLMEDVGVPKEKYSQMRADRIARLIVDSCPAHLSLSSWAELITKSIVELFPVDDPNDAFAEMPAIIIDVDKKEAGAGNSPRLDDGNPI